MSGLELSDLYRDLQRAGHGISKNSPLMTSCESELSELIRQIDIMFKSKKNEWQREKTTYELKVETKSREVQLQQESIDRKNQEITRLREHAMQAEKEDKKLISDYQLQVEQLHKDLMLLKKQYEKMRNKHQKEKVKLTAEKYELETNNMAKDKKQLQFEVDRLLSTVKSLTEKCELMEQQGSTYQDQLVKRNQMIGDIEANLRAELATIRSQLHETEDRESERNVEIARLKADLNHWKNKSAKLSKELQTSEELLKKANSTVNTLQSQNDGLNAELKAQGSNLHMATRGQHCQEKEMVKLRDMIIEKDKTIRSLLDKNHLDESTALDVLKQDLLKVDLENRELKLREAEYKTEVTRLQAECASLIKRLDNTDQECLSLREQLHKKETELRETEDQRLRDRDANLNELQEKIFSLKSDHDAEVTELRKELQDVRAQLCETLSRNNQTCLMTTFSEGDDSRMDAVNAAIGESHAAADLRLTQQQLTALRLENQHLQEQVLNSKDAGHSVRQAQRHLTDIQSSYDNTVDKLKADNDRLHTDVAKLRSEMKTKEESYHHRYRKLLQDMQLDIERREARLLEEHTLNQSRLQDTQDAKLEVREAVYRQEMGSLRAQKSLLMERLGASVDEVSRYKEENRDLAHENQLMSSFTGNISDMLAMASSSKCDVNNSQYNSAFDEQTTDFLPFGASPDPVRRLIGDETLNSTLRDSHTHSSPSKSARSNDHHNSTSTPKKASMNRSPYDTRGQISRSSRSHNSSKSSSHKSRSSNHDQGTASPLSRKSQSARTSPAHRKGSRDVSPRSNPEPRVSPTSGRGLPASRLSSIRGAEDSYAESLNSSSTGSLVAERFLRDQRQRTLALEQMLDEHIQGLREDSRLLMQDSDSYLHSF